MFKIKCVCVCLAEEVLLNECVRERVSAIRREKKRKRKIYNSLTVEVVGF